MSDFDEGLGRALRSLRDINALSVLDLVERTGIPGSDLEAYEAGAAVPPARLASICAAFGVSLQTFMGRVLPPRSGAGPASTATPEEGCTLIEWFRQIPDAGHRRFLIDMAHALGDYDFKPEGSASE